MKDISGQALRVHTDKRRGREDIAMDQRDHALNPFRRRGQSFVARLWIGDYALKTVNPKLAPTGGQIGFSYFTNSFKGHRIDYSSVTLDEYGVALASEELSPSRKRQLE